MPQFLEKWAVSMALGGKPVALPGSACFPAVSSRDGKYLVVVLRHQLRVYFLQTRQCIRTVEFDASDAVAVALDPGNGNQLVVFTPSHVRYVNWMEKVDHPVAANLALTPAIEGLNDVFVCLEDAYYAVARPSGGSLLQIVKIDREHASTSVVFECSNVVEYAVSAQGTKLAVALDSQQVVLYDLAAVYLLMEQPQLAVEATQEKYAHTTKLPTCMAVSDEGVVALGSTSGVIQLVYGGTNSDLPTRTLRWHMDPVRSLAFSHDLTYLVSGGNEKVLVFWHLDLDRTQFLPRLAGTIDRIYVDANRPDHYSVALEVDSDSHEILTLLAVDLVSRLSVSPIRPNFATPVAHAEARARKRLEKGHLEVSSIRHDITTPMTVHPTNRQLYFAKGAAIQAFDVVRGEQAFVQHAAPQISTGRVKSEHKVADPTVSQVAFTPDGLWMATFDSMPTLDFDNLLLKNDTAYALKFWRSSDDGWHLALKIVDPHGPGHDVGALFAGPENSFTTVDAKGGVRVWKAKQATSSGQTQSNGSAIQPVANTPATLWSLRKSSPSTANSGSVAGCYSSDGSLLVVAHGCSLQTLDPALLQPIAFQLPGSDSPIEKVAIAGSHLIIVSQSRLVSFDLVEGTETELSARISTLGAGHLVAVDSVRQIIAVATNYFETDPQIKLRGKLMVMKPDTLTPLYTCAHGLAIASITATPSGFVFVDTDSRIGLLAPQVKSNLADSDDLATQMEKMLVSAQAAANVLYARAAETKADKFETTDDTEKWTSHKLIDTALLLPIFANVEGVSMDTLFEKVVRAVQ